MVEVFAIISGITAAIQLIGRIIDFFAGSNQLKKITRQLQQLKKEHSHLCQQIKRLEQQKEDEIKARKRQQKKNDWFQKQIDHLRYKYQSLNKEHQKYKKSQPKSIFLFSRCLQCGYNQILDRNIRQYGNFSHQNHNFSEHFYLVKEKKIVHVCKGCNGQFEANKHAFCTNPEQKKQCDNDINLPSIRRNRPYNTKF